MSETPNYAFMKSGNSVINTEPQIDPNHLISLLTLFIKNAMINAAKYVEYSNRNGITQTDVLYGLKYEVFEFLSRPNLTGSLEDIQNDYMNDDNEEIDEEELNKMIVPDGEIDSFTEIGVKLINVDNKEFIDKMHHYNNTWDDWNPTTPLEKSLQKAINISIENMNDNLEYT